MGGLGAHRTREHMLSSGVALCGYKTHDGIECVREAGWGTPNKGVGRCRDHTDEALAQLEQKKERFLERMGAQPNTIFNAAEEAGISMAAIYRALDEDPFFKKSFDALKKAIKWMRLGIIEDTAFFRAADRTANADTLRIFMLQNMDPETWKDRRRVEHTGADGGAIESHVEHTGSIAWKIGDKTLKFGAPSAMKQIAAGSSSNEVVIEQTGEDADE